MPKSEIARQKGLLGVRSRDGDHEGAQIARRDLAAAKIADYIRRTVAAAPPLTTEQREKLAGLLRGGGADAA